MTVTGPEPASPGGPIGGSSRVLEASTVPWDQGSVRVPKPTLDNDPLAAFFESERGDRLWQQWCVGVSNQQVKEQYGEDVLEAVIASELMLQQQAQARQEALSATASVEGDRGGQAGSE